MPMESNCYPYLASGDSAMTLQFTWWCTGTFRSWTTPQIRMHKSKKSSSNSSPTRSFIRSHSSSCSFAPSLPPTPLDFISPNKGPIAFSLASSPTSFFLSAQPCQLISSLYKFMTSFRLSSLHHQHLVYRCSTHCSAWPNRHWGVNNLSNDNFATCPSPNWLAFHHPSRCSRQLKMDSRMTKEFSVR